MASGLIRARWFGRAGDDSWSPPKWESSLARVVSVVGRTVSVVIWADMPWPLDREGSPVTGVVHWGDGLSSTFGQENAVGGTPVEHTYDTHFSYLTGDLLNPTESVARNEFAIGATWGVDPETGAAVPGASTREIAKVAGVSKSTVATAKQVSSSGHLPSEAPAKVLGADGKSKKKRASRAKAVA